MYSKEQVLIEQIKKASEAYYTTGKSNLTDEEFDILVEELEIINPNAEILNKREIHGDDWNYKLETLPKKLYSIKKIKTWKEIQNWMDFIKSKIPNIDISNLELVLSPKYDGCKITNFDKKFFTRYEGGEQGYNVTKRIISDIKNNKGLGFEGELIISKSNFKKYCQDLGYSSSRNFIPAIFSSETKLSIQDKIEYIRYSIYSNHNYSKEQELISCNEMNNVKVPYLVIKYKDLTEQTIIDFYFQNISDFEYDGVVIDINDVNLRDILGETEKYLHCCRAYKGDILFNDIKDSKIENITWQMSRYGKLTPVAKIIPTIINEGVVTNVSLYNAAYIRDNNIFVGQNIKVARKGKINPKIVGFIDEGNSEKSDIPAVCLFCGEELIWTESNIDLICKNDSCKEKLIQKLYFFFKTIGVQNFGLESVRAFVDKGFNYYDFFNEEKILNIYIEGIGSKIKKSFIDEINRVRKDIKIEKLQEASGLFQGISSTTLKMLNTLNVDMEFYFEDKYYNEIYKQGLALDGIGEITMEDYLSGLYKFYNKCFWNDNIKPYFTIKQNEVIKKEDNKKERFENKYICFTGFRNSDWNRIIEEEGGKVLSTVTSSCNILVIKDINSTSSKIQKAKQMEIKIMSIEDFKNLIEN